MEGKLIRRDKTNQKLSTLSINAKPRDYSDEIIGIDKRIQGLNK